MRDNPEPGDKSGEIQKFFHGEVGKIACIFHSHPIPSSKIMLFSCFPREGSLWSQVTSLLCGDLLRFSLFRRSLPHCYVYLYVFQLIEIALTGTLFGSIC
jgi:hypothetical protein